MMDDVEIVGTTTSIYVFSNINPTFKDVFSIFDIHSFKMIISLTVL
jgi:hypothetical protein